MRCFSFLMVVIFFSGCGYGGDGGTQGEVDFAVENLLLAPIYVNWSTAGSGLVACQTGSDECRFDPPGCTPDCSEQNLQQDCCMACEMAYPAIKIIDPGESLMINWSGKLYPSDWEHCSDCDCYREVDAEPGSYHAEVCVYAGHYCEFEPCDGPDAQGVIMGASPTGTPDCYTKNFSVPYSKAYLIISIQ